MDTSWYKQQVTFLMEEGGNLVWRSLRATHYHFHLIGQCDSVCMRPVMTGRSGRVLSQILIRFEGWLNCWWETEHAPVWHSWQGRRVNQPRLCTYIKQGTRAIWASLGELTPTADIMISVGVRPVNIGQHWLKIGPASSTPAQLSASVGTGMRICQIAAGEAMEQGMRSMVLSSITVKWRQVSGGICWSRRGQIPG